MSPAMVDFKSSASASSNLHPDRPGSGSSIKGRSPSSSSHPLFSPSDTPEHSPTMNRGNLRPAVSVSSSAFCPPLFPSFSAVEKPAPAQRHSAPRLLKQRKHSVASRARPAATALDGGATPEFNPFRSELLGRDHMDRAEDRRTQSVLDQLYGWKPFAPDASSRLPSGTGFLFGDASSGSNASSCNTGPGSSQGTAFGVDNNGKGNTGTGLFVFGSGMAKVSSRTNSSSLNSSAQSSGSIDSTKSEGAELFGAGSFSDSNVKTVEIGKPVCGSVCPVSADNVFSDTGVFVFGSNAKKDGILHHHSSLGSDNDSFSNLKSQKPVIEKSGKLDSSFFGLESDEKKNTHSSKNLPFGSDEGLFKETPDRTKKMDQPNSSKDCQKACTGFYAFGSFEKLQANAGQSSSTCFNENSVSNLPEDLRKLKIENSSRDENGKKDPSIFVFGSDVKNSAYASKRSSFGSFDHSFSKLPEKMENLNIKNSSDEVLGDADSVRFVSGSSLKKGAQFTQTSSSDLDEGTFSKLPCELRKLNLQSLGKEEHGKDGHRVFIFGSNVNNSTKSCKSSSPSFDKGSISKLPNEIGKMKLSSSGSEDDTQNRRQGDTQNKCDSSVAFMFAANMDTVTSTETSSPSKIPDFQPFERDLNLNSMHTGLETPKMEFRNQEKDTSWLTKDKLFAEPHKSTAFGMRKGESKGVRLKKKRDKSKQSAPIHSGIEEQFVSLGKGSEGNLEEDATCEYSPMDYSPYQETSGSNQCSREASVTYDEPLHFDPLYTSTDTQRPASTDGKEEELVSKTEYIGAKEGTPAHEEAECYGSSAHCAGQCNLGSCLEDEMIPEIGKGNCVAKDTNFGHGIQTRASVESESFSFGPRIRQPTAEGGSGFTVASNSQDVSQSNILFGTKSSVRRPLSERSYRRKISVKRGQDSHINTKVPLPYPVSNLFPFPNAHDQKEKVIDSHESAGKVNEPETNPESTATSSASVTAQEACEKWRLRGNQAYADGNLFKAEDYYSRGVNTLSLKKISKSCSHALMLCYSNRAATRMSLGRLREALVDCYMAVEIDPSFLRARVRAGNIHLLLGETGDALQHFQKCLERDNDAKSDQKILLEAANGLEKAQKLNDLINHSSVFLAKRTSSDATKALEIISEALSIGPFSESLLEMKAEALVMLRNYEEAIHACEQTLELAEKNAVVTESNCHLKDNGCPESVERSHVSLWRWRIISKSYFYLGKLEEANELLQKHETVKPVIEKYGNRDPESTTSFPVVVCELLRLKTAGNEAFQAGRHLEAVELYTAALVLNTESRPFTAICFCNRAAAFQALGQITDAVADCSLAIALDSSYRKAISRRATLHEMIRDFGQAATDLCRLISLLEKSSEDKYNTCGALGRSSSNVNDLNQARKRLYTVEEEARKGATLDMYMILGIERSSSTADVRKAYRKAALRHHPDKAGQFLARSDNGDDRVWKEVADEVYSDADRLFKMIGEAYAILVDPSKRRQYDAEEDLRNMKGYGGNSSPRTPANSFSSQYEQSADQRHGRRYGSMHQ